MANTTAERKKIINWFESDFKESAKASTRISRLDDGRVSYEFSVLNNSGYDFDKFSFNVRISNKEDGKEIGSSTIKVGSWETGDKKNFKSNIDLPSGVKSISFVMYAESIKYAISEDADADEAPSYSSAEAQAARQRLAERGVTTESYAQARLNKKLDALRLGKSKAFKWFVGIGILFTVAVFGAEKTTQAMEYAAVAFGCYIAAIITRALANSKAKRIRAYEAVVSRKGNTSLYDIAASVGRKVNAVADDLQTMITQGFFPGAYLDMENLLIVMTKDGEALQSVEESAAASKKARRKAAREQGLVPDSVDDLLIMTDDKDIKAKLGELKAVMDRIDARIAEKPEMKDQVKEYNERYYPEVVRLTDEYNEKIANLDAEDANMEKSDAEINLSKDSLASQAREIKKSLIDLIDDVVEASENLLEKLHEDEMLDISSDIRSVQTTIASKGLLDSDFDITL